MIATVLKAEILKFRQIQSNTKQRIVSAQDRPHTVLKMSSNNHATGEIDKQQAM